MNLSEMSRSELEQLKADVEQAIVAAADRDRKEALVAARNAAAEFGFSLDELTGSGKSAPGKRAKSEPKYRNPENPDQTWSGRGRKPNWVHEALQNGREITDLAI